MGAAGLSRAEARAVQAGWRMARWVRADARHLRAALTVRWFLLGGLGISLAALSRGLAR